ncbi:MAG: phosphatidylserine/phosphatidylglycerophosphate/cardiolipin synthase family protein [Bdellovibrionales bacterium]|nr:phosphatidylserine/phosphatidylglycerophosphate/cardiolipin synthase family protein [Bdellovibrionales bacterium]
MEILTKVKSFKKKPSLPPQVWEEEVLFLDSDSYFQSLIQGIEQAKCSIALETYIFSRGYLGDRIVKALIQAHHRGVKVRVMVDGVGSPQFWKNYGNSLTDFGIEVMVFRPWPWQNEIRKEKWVIFFLNFFYKWYWINRGNHRKSCLIDNVTAWIGSMNISDHHLKEVYNQKAWLDIGIQIQGPELKKLREAFDHTFFKKKSSSLALLSQKGLIFFNTNLLQRRLLVHHQLTLFKKAQRKIWIQTPYFVPIRPIYRRLIRKARKGCDVRIILPRMSDIPLLKPLSYTFFYKLIKSGVKIYEYGPPFTHQKILHLDDTVLIGSSNINHRSFFHDLEVDVLVTHKENKLYLVEKFLKEQSSSREITLTTLQKMGGWKLWFQRLLLLVRYWS